MVVPYFYVGVIVMCPYSVDKSDILHKNLICTIDNKTCGLWRYCPTLKKPVMSDFYNKYGCRTKNEFENNQKDGDENGQV